ncbi:MAG TPA: hypothetical protein VHB45_15565 [Alloacidobacterium sp.]|nr:hypothetical protein [Alloacidobacterium sp.]
MARSFDCVDFKLAEADFFLEHLKTCTNPLWGVNFYFSAFVSAARSVTFALQAVMDGQPGFAEWYAKKQDEMRADPICRFFVGYRNEVLKTGELPITGGYGGFVGAAKNNGTKLELKYRFGRSILTGEQLPAVDRTEFIQRAIVGGQGEKREEEPDAIACCCEYMRKMVALVRSCYADFGSVIDPDEYYTIDNLRKINRSIEELEAELGFPRGWTSVGDHTDEERLRALCAHVPRSSIKHLFDKYAITPS